ncbi:MAG: radical SAM family heme chaperone HemW [Proteobacteria bacterium]|nr:radical SAM family heme chaperone HemW [Pseudomonadota bacterium]
MRGRPWTERRTVVEGVEGDARARGSEAEGKEPQRLAAEGRGMEQAASHFGVYVHYPLCRRRCGYCDFAVVEQRDFPAAAYTDQVCSELQARADDYRAGTLRTIYFGGGTPSLWPVEQIARVLAAIRGSFRLASALEVTLEANPGTLDAARLRAWRSAGVNRLSLGLQSLDDAMLRTLGRDHDAAEARAALRAARDAGFDNLSCDLICGVGGQTVAHHLEQIALLTALAPEHISLYALTLARGSTLWRAGLRPAEEDRAADLLERGREALAAAGYPQYEVSNFGPVERRSRHNALVWAGRPYLGLGAAAHSLQRVGPRHLRLINPPSSRYLGARCLPAGAQGSPAVAQVAGARVRLLEPETARFEVMLLGLRTVDGVTRAAYRAYFGADPLDDFSGPLQELEGLGLVRIDDARVAPTAQGIWFADELALRLLRPARAARADRRTPARRGRRVGKLGAE